MNIGIVGYGLVGRTIHDALGGFQEYVFYINDIKYPERFPTKDQLLQFCQYIFLCVDTPYRNNQPDMSNIYSAVEELYHHIQDGDNPVILIKSTMVPGTTEDLQALFPEFRFVVNPEFLREATALEDFLHPDRVVVGTDDVELALTLFHKLFYHFVTPLQYCVVSPTAAELVKLLSNALLTVKVAFANLVDVLAARIGFPADTVMDAVTLDHRFHASHLTPSLGKISRSSLCLPKDLLMLRDYLVDAGIDSGFLNEVYKLGVANE